MNNNNQDILDLIKKDKHGYTVKIDRKARTIVPIDGNAIKTIPVGTELVITYPGTYYSHCTGLSVLSIYNYEVELV